MKEETEKISKYRYVGRLSEWTAKYLMGETNAVRVKKQTLFCFNRCDKKEYHVIPFSK